MRRLITFITATAAAATLAAAATVATTATTAAEGTGTVQSASAMASCDSLASLALPNTTITGASLVGAGAFTPPGPQNDRARAAAARTYGGLPEFCRVEATLAPSDDSDIKVEVWLPAADWNGKYQAVGNGAFTGSIRHNSMAAALARGYASSSTDTGHEGNTASFGLGHPEKVIDFGWRSLEEMSVTAKAAIEAYYGEAPQYSYWNGCSAGGRQALKAAQRLPEHFDGIIAGAPGNDWTGRAGGSLRVAKPLEANEAARLTADLRRARARGGPRGVRRRRRRHRRGRGRSRAVRVRPGGAAVRRRPGERLPVRGAGEHGAHAVLVAREPPVGASHHRAPARQRAGLDRSGLDPLGAGDRARAVPVPDVRRPGVGTIDRFNFETDIVAAEEVDNDTLNALDPNLQPFFDRGGRLISYHGWADPQISPANATQYYRRVVDAVGDADTVHDHYRLFMAPGMGHCGGGAGPSRFDMLTALEDVGRAG